ncbi:secreted RxLR effector protein 161-like [Pyrus x bretschneideri]|uniref:secreted RxLR effector protein 161-like n=1 Tax=Pyrus x bretschneideri TaxID=225117 RepID=UPI002030BBCD|nr:secreted RxLR effector protein 161-like [Pyrus x bretschneideri]
MPDLGFVVSVRGHFQSNTRNSHWAAAKKVLRYLKRTRNVAVVYQLENLEMVAYSDSDLAGYVDDRKSTSGYVFLLVDGAVSWKSSKQKVIASSTITLNLLVVTLQPNKQSSWEILSWD